MIGVIGAGAFGTALAVTLGREGRPVTLWARDATHVQAMAEARQNTARLPGIRFPPSLTVTADLGDLAGIETVLLALPMQMLGTFLQAHGAVLTRRTLVACCKGVDLNTLRGPSALIAAACPDATPAILTGPSFAADIGQGLPTALTIAVATGGEALQRQLSTATLRIYRSSDVVGAELGGALKNVYAIAAGVVVGAGLGSSARAALMTRGYAEMQRFAIAMGARAETLAGLSGLGDLVLTCTSPQSRNLRYGMALGAGQGFDAGVTVEGVATAQAVTRMARALTVEMPIADTVAALVARRVPLDDAIRGLMSRPLKAE